MERELRPQECGWFHETSASLSSRNISKDSTKPVLRRLLFLELCVDLDEMQDVVPRNDPRDAPILQDGQPS